MIETKTPTKPGFDIAIEVRGSIFNLKNAFESENGHTHIDIHDEDGKFIDEFCSGFAIDPQDDPESFEYNTVKVYEYIDDNLVF